MDRVLGQDRAIRTLQSALLAGRMHHALIFHGPPGVGKFTTALALARTLLCHAPVKSGDRPESIPIKPCGGCASCRLFAAAPAVSEGDEDAPPSTAHPDLHVVTKELARYHSDKKIRDRKMITIPVDILRESLIEPIFKTVQLRHGKVFICDEAELIDERGQNLLLKSLEEPPEGTYIILVTSKEDRLLLTIRSRCQRVAFGVLPDGVVERWLEHMEEARSLSAAQKSWVIGFAAGSFGQAALAVRYHLANWAATFTPMLDEAEKKKFPAELGKAMSQAINELAERWVDDHDNASKEAANRMAAGLLFRVITQHARRRIDRIAGQHKDATLSEKQRALAPWLGAIEAVQRAEMEIFANLMVAQVCDHLAVGLFARIVRADAGVGSVALNPGGVVDRV